MCLNDVLLYPISQNYVNICSDVLPVSLFCEVNAYFPSKYHCNLPLSCSSEKNHKICCLSNPAATSGYLFRASCPSSSIESVCPYEDSLYPISQSYVNIFSDFLPVSIFYEVNDSFPSYYHYNLSLSFSSEKNFKLRCLSTLTETSRYLYRASCPSNSIFCSHLDPRGSDCYPCFSEMPRFDMTVNAIFLKQLHNNDQSINAISVKFKENSQDQNSLISWLVPSLCYFSDLKHAKIYQGCANSVKYNEDLACQYKFYDFNCPCLLRFSKQICEFLVQSCQNTYPTDLFDLDWFYLNKQESAKAMYIENVITVYLKLSYPNANCASHLRFAYNSGVCTCSIFECPYLYVLTAIMRFRVNLPENFGQHENSYHSKEENVLKYSDVRSRTENEVNVTSLSLLRDHYTCLKNLYYGVFKHQLKLIFNMCDYSYHKLSKKRCMYYIM